jgi:hypothetical protein
VSLPPKRRRDRTWAVALLLLAALVVGWWVVDKGREVAPDDEAETTTAMRPDGAATEEIPNPYADPSRTSAITGRVTARGGAAIEGATVCALGHDARLASVLTRDPFCARSDGEGRYRIQGLPPARYDVTGHAPRHRPTRYQAEDGDTAVPLGPDEIVEGIDLVLAPGGVPVRGVVYDGLGGPIEGAWVQARPGQWPRMGVSRTAGWPVRTDADGAFEVWTAPGEVGLVAQADGYASGERTTAAPTDGVVIRLAPEVVIEGTVVDAATKDLVDGAFVTANVGLAHVSAWSDARGRFRLDRLPAGRVHVGAQTDDAYGRLSSSLVLTLGETREVTIELHPTRTIVGRVIDEDSHAPCSRGSVTLVAGTGGAQRSGSIGDDGVVTIRGVFPATYRVMIQCPGKLSDAEAPPLVVGEEPVGEQAWTVRAGETLRGEVVDEAGDAVASARIEAIPTAEDARARLAFGATTADDDGHFVLTGLLAGKYRVAAMHGAGPLSSEPVVVDLADVSEPVRLVLPSGATIEGHVRDASGNPIVDAQVLASPMGATEGQGRAFTDHEGHFALLQLAAGRYRVHAEGMDDGTGPEVSATAGVTQTVDLTAPARGETVDGRVVDHEGEPVADATVRIFRNGYRAWAWRDATWVLTDAHGRFAFDDLAEGSYRLEAGRGAATEGTVDAVQTGQTVELTIPPLASLAGEVTLVGGGTPERFTVRVRGPDIMVESFEHTHGRWSIDAVAPGPLGITAESPEGTASVGLELEPGQDRTDVDFALARPGRLTGRLVDAQTSEPVVGAEVSVSDASGVTTHSRTDQMDEGRVTDADGHFDVAAGPGPVRMDVRPPPEPAHFVRTFHVAARIESAEAKDLGTVELPRSCGKVGVDGGWFGFNWATPKGDVAAEGGIPITEVAPGSPMAKAGLATNDEIVAVDGVNVAGGAWPNLRPLITCPVGHPVAFELADGRTIEVAPAKRPK